MGPPWPKHPCMDRHQATNRMKFSTEQVQSTNKLQVPNYQIEDGWRTVFCTEIKNSTELDGCIVLSLYEPENRKLLYAKHKREAIDERSPILIRRIKDTKRYEISTLSLRDKSPSELRLLAFTSIAELKRFDIEAQVTNNPTETKEPVNSINTTKAGDAQPTKRKVLHAPNRAVKITVIKADEKLAHKGAEKDKNRLEKSLLDQQKLPNAKAKRREEILKKRQQQKIKREARERDEKNNTKQRTQTALENAFEKALITGRKGNV